MLSIIASNIFFLILTKYSRPINYAQVNVVLNNESLPSESDK